MDSAIKQAYSILKSWRRSYIKGERARAKPTVKRRFVRVKETLYSYKNGVVRVSIKPFEKYLEFDLRRVWFLSRFPKDAEMGEPILNESYLTVTFRFRKKENRKDGITWDFNEKSLDGFNPKLGWIKVDLTELFHIHRVYELKRMRLQKKASRKPSLRKVLAKYSRRERNRAKDFVHKLTTTLATRFKDYAHGLENLEKKRMLNNSKKYNRNITKTDWKTIRSLMAYKSKIIPLNPKNSSRRCSRCGMLNAQKGHYINVNVV